MGAAKGNKNALGNKGGHPPAFKSKKKLQEKIDAYFQWCTDNPVKTYHTAIDKETNKPFEIDNVRPYTIEGLATYLGITPRTLLNYEKEPTYVEFFPIISAAKTKITQQRVELASLGVFKEGFTKFLLTNNNPDYVDRVEQKNTNVNTNTNVNFNSVEMSKEEIREISDALEDEV